MAEGPRRILFAGLAVLVGLLFAHSGRLVAAEGLAAEQAALQPAALNHVGIYDLKAAEPGLTGAGVRIGAVCRSFTYIDGLPQNDYRPGTGHNCLNAKEFVFHDYADGAAGVSPHSTAICSILFGRDDGGFNPAIGGFRYEGIVPEAEADIYEFWHFLIEHVYHGAPPEADIITVSIGDQFEHWWTRGIESMVEQFGVIVVGGIGNGSNVHDPLLYPGAGANVIGVGVVDTSNSKNLAKALANLALAYPEHSSFGPTSDGRCKPDIVAPGNCLAAETSEPNRYEPTGNWSSYSTPIVSGTLGLLVQKANADANLAPAVSPAGGSCVMKALLMNSATKLPYWHKGRLEAEDDHEAPLDHIQGAGMLNAAGAYRHLVAGINGPGEVPATGWDLNQVDNGENGEKVYRFSVEEPAGKFIAVTAAWNRHYEGFYPFRGQPDKDTDIRLELWAVDANNGGNSYLLDYSDSPVDNVEHIYHRADANYTNYEVVISCSDAEDANQPGKTERYGLAWDVRSVSAKADNILHYDLNADGIVDEADVVVFIENSLASIGPGYRYALGDINSDGAIDYEDLKILMENIDRQADWRSD